MPNKLTVASTLANDILLNPNNEEYLRQPGGPLFYIRRALDSINIPYQSYSAGTVDVQILVEQDEEFGRILKPRESQSITRLGEVEWLMLSTIVDEWILDFKKIPKHLFIDIQGFVRDPKSFGEKHKWDPPKSISEKILCLKGTEAEINCLSPEIINSQKQRILVITKGSGGVDIYIDGELHHLDTRKISGLKNTIGAGDTYFAYFVGSLYSGSVPLNAAAIALEKTAKMLEERVLAAKTVF